MDLLRATTHSALLYVIKLFIALPDPSQQFMYELKVVGFFVQFLWDDKTSKI